MMLTQRWLFTSAIYLSPTSAKDLCCRYLSSTKGINHIIKSKETPIVESLCRRIRATGPITVADYMRECLTHPKYGYYMKKDVFGAKGDFITSPEISQMFGELLGVWIASEYQTVEQPSHLHIIELGPGRGTLSADILRTLCQFEFIKHNISLHLIDVSPKMRELQAKNICDKSYEDTNTVLTSKYGTVNVSWHNSIAEVPLSGRTCFIAHEFFDALPIHKFQKTESGEFHEVLVDISSDVDPHHFRHVLSPSPNANCRIFVKPNEERDHVEVSPLSGMIVQEIGAKIDEHGGFALIADYGHNGDKEDTFRGFKSHKLYDALNEPGEADLTADVDFSFLRHCLSPFKVICHGPLSQQRFLHNMGISMRLKALLSAPSITDQTRNDLLSSYKMLCSPDEMGERFKFFSIHQHGHQFKVAGFSEITGLP